MLFRSYFGSRTCKGSPEEDVKYFGSFYDKNFKPTQKIILKSDYLTREEAYVDEIILQEYYKVVENPHFANRAYQTSTGFSRKNAIPHNKGKSMSEEQRKKLSNSSKGRKLSEEIKKKIGEKIKKKVKNDDIKKDKDRYIKRKRNRYKMFNKNYKELCSAETPLETEVFEQCVTHAREKLKFPIVVHVWPLLVVLFTKSFGFPF